VDIGGPRQRAVLARLVPVKGRILSIDRMIDDLWPRRPPRTAAESLRAYVSRLRRVLEPERVPGEPARVLAKVGVGYTLRLPDDAVDAWLFERLVDQARGCGQSRPAKARALLHEALDLWQGRAYGETAEPWAAAESVRLEELFMAARELLLAVMLRTGAVAEAVPAAELLTREQPLREEGWRLLTVALWGSGRQAHALSALRRSRRALATAAGLDPGPVLVELERAILTQRTELLAESLPH
jgi:DNA-binding SARP family transcriptional activator